MKRALTLMCVVAVLLAGVSLAEAAKAVVSGNGISAAKDAKAAGAEAANKAKAALGDCKATLVLVHYSGPMIGKAAQVAEGVATVFDKDIIYGCGAYSAITQDDNNATVAVLALGGDAAVTAVVAEAPNPKQDVACGTKLGEQLKDAAAQGPGKVLLLFGACHIPRNNQVVKGICSVLGDTFPIVGAAAFADSVVAKGEVVQAKSNVALLITGNFACGFGLNKDMSPDGLISSATKTFETAIGDKKDKVAIVLVFDCGGRRGAMLKNKNFPKELEAMKAAAGKAPIFGFYGSGEMGCKATGAAPTGVGYHISACAIVNE